LLRSEQQLFTEAKLTVLVGTTTGEKKKNHNTAVEAFQCEC